MSTMIQAETPLTGEQQPLTDLAAQINHEHSQAEASARTAIRHALAAGELLGKAKALVEHGQWGEWLAGNFRGSVRTAQAYMRIAKNWEAIAKAQSSADLSIDGALTMIRERIFVPSSTSALFDSTKRSAYREAFDLAARDVTWWWAVGAVLKWGQSHQVERLSDLSWLPSLHPWWAAMFGLQMVEDKAMPILREMVDHYLCPDDDVDYTLSALDIDIAISLHAHSKDPSPLDPEGRKWANNHDPLVKAMPVIEAYEAGDYCTACDVLDSLGWPPEVEEVLGTQEQHQADVAALVEELKLKCDGLDLESRDAAMRQWFVEGLEGSGLSPSNAAELANAIFSPVVTEVAT